MKKIVAPNWFKIEGKWYHCIIDIVGNTAKHYINGKYSHSVTYK